MSWVCLAIHMEEELYHSAQYVKYDMNLSGLWKDEEKENLILKQIKINQATSKQQNVAKS